MKPIKNIEKSEECGSFFFEINGKGINYWWFYFTGGHNDDGSRVTMEQEAILADEIYKRLTCHDELVEALTLLLDRTSKCSDLGYNPIKDSVHDKCTEALDNAKGQA